MSNLELLDRAAGATTCQILNRAGEELIGVAVWTLWNPKLSAATFGAGALSLLASNYLCPDMPMGGKDPADRQGCQLTLNGGFPIRYDPVLGEGGAGFSGEVWVEIVDIEKRPVGDGTEYEDHRLTALHLDGNIYDTSPNQWIQRRIGTTYGMRPKDGEACSGSDDGSLPLPPSATEPIEYVDDSTNCTYNVTLQGFAQETEGGVVSPVYLIEGASEQRAGGGRMGGCNFPPTIYMPSYGGGGGGGGGGVHVPVPSPLPDPGDGVPWWLGPLVGGSVSAGLNLIGQEIAKLSESDFEPGSFTMTAPCDYDENGEHQYRTWEFLAGSFEQRIHAHQVALMEMLQQHLDWKTPTCRSDKPELEGDWRTISFISDNLSPYGRDRLRKRFRYRSTSGWTDDALVDHWKDFIWESGSVIVQHSGASWGTPQVWASTADEGKRVIRHAAGEAGIDPDQVGRWTISGSRSARYGVPDTMRVCTKRGYYWITARDGSDARPLVGKTSHP
tara:strand:+ start:3076 stop:4578 length:1503 start_codon:yes stop_codon:yes gene_type:complete